MKRRGEELHPGSPRSYWTAVFTLDRLCKSAQWYTS